MDTSLAAYVLNHKCSILERHF